jgi:hypothetical protein
MIKMNKDPIANDVHKQYENMKICSNKGIQILFHKKNDKSKYSGITAIVQKTGKIDAKTMRNLVENGTFESSSQFSFREVVSCHIIEAKLIIDTIGVIKGKANIKRTNIALIP